MALFPFSLCACATTGADSPALADPPDLDPSADPDPEPSDPPALALSKGLEKEISHTIPGGLACLVRLRKLGVSFTAAGSLPNVLTPVKVTGPIGGVTYRPLYKTPMICDCRMVLALNRAGPYLKALGVEEMLYSSVYRQTKIRGSRRLSRHAKGLAIDIHRVVANGETLKVKEDFQPGMEVGCTDDFPLLNRVACVLSRRGLFDRVLTPDYDEAHFNHFHLAILSLHRRRFVPKDTLPAPDAD